MSDSSRLDETHAQQILAATGVGYAMLGSADELLASNRAFKEAAAVVGLEPSDYARQIAEGPAEEREGGIGATVIKLEPTRKRLIELLPFRAGQPEASALPERDEVTGVLTRPVFVSRLKSSLSDAARVPFALVFLDLDGFKSVNDRFGHLTGDACLKEVGKRLTEAVRGGDLVGRFGGDEFLVLLQGVDSPERFEPIGRRLKQAMEPEFAGPEGPIRLGVSFGVAYAADDEASVEELVATADRAMYASKRQQNSSSR